MNEATNIDGCYVFPASPGQERLWFLQHYDESLGAVYNMSTAFKIQTALNHIALQKALNTLVQRHEALRTALAFRGGALKQLIQPRLLKTINFVDCSAIAEKNVDAAVLRKIQQDAGRAFDMTEFGLLKLSLYQLSQENYYLLIVIHHSVSDGVSLELFVDQLFKEYLLACNAEESNTAPPEFQFADISEWNREWYGSSEYIDHAKYWQAKLEKVPLSINLPKTPHQNEPQVHSYDGHIKHLCIKADHTARLKEVAKATGTTDYTVLFAAFAMLIHCYSGQDEFLVGVPVANRTQEETNQTIGFLANTVVIRVTFHEGITVEQLIKQIHQSTTQAVAYQRYPYRHLHELLSPQRQANNNSLFQVMFGYQDVPQSIFSIDGKPIERVPVNTNLSRFDLSLFLFNEGGTISGFFEYNTGLYECQLVDRFIDHFCNICVAIPETMHGRVSSIQCYTEKEAQITLQLLKAVSAKGLLSKQLASAIQEKNISISDQSEIKIVDRCARVVAPQMVGELWVDGHACDIRLRISYDGSITQLSAPSDYLTLEADEEEQVFVGAQSDTEIELEALWKKLLDHEEPISVSSSFFSLGGHSMLVAKMVDLVAEHFKVVVSMKDIFFNPTISHIAKKIDFLQQGFSQEEGLPDELDIKKDEYMGLMRDFI